MPMLGYENVLLINTHTGTGTTWTEVDLARDVTVNKEKGEINATSRVTARLGWEATKEGLKKFSIDFDSLKPSPGESNAAFTKLNAAFLANTSVEVAIADGAITGTAVPAVKVICGVFGGNEGQPLNDMATISFSLKANAVPEFGTFTSSVFTES